jgi:hypothetical protein
MSACRSIAATAFQLRLSIILVRSRTNQIEDLLPLVNAIMLALETIQPGQTIAIPLSAVQQ